MLRELNAEEAETVSGGFSWRPGPGWDGTPPVDPTRPKPPKPGRPVIVRPPTDVPWGPEGPYPLRPGYHLP